MVVKAALTAKIDRPAGIIRFGGVKKPEEVCYWPPAWASSAKDSCQSPRCLALLYSAMLGQLHVLLDTCWRVSAKDLLHRCPTVLPGCQQRGEVSATAWLLGTCAPAIGC